MGGGNNDILGPRLQHNAHGTRDCSGGIDRVVHNNGGTPDDVAHNAVRGGLIQSGDVS